MEFTNPENDHRAERAPSRPVHYPFVHHPCWRTKRNNMPGELHRLSAAEIAGLVRSRTISAQDCIAYFLKRIKLYNGRLNAVVTLAPESQERAADADARMAAGGRCGPLHGVPFTVKDTIVTAGLPATAGSVALTNFIPRQSAPVVSRLVEAGAILLGKTNCSEFAVDTHAGNLLFGDTRNPWDLTRTPGGSSGGDSAAVSAGLTAFGLGTDFGGSIRWPAHCTGTTSLRPTIGLIPGTGVLPFPLSSELQPPNSMSLMHHFMTVGPIARKVEDLQLLLGVLAGPDGMDEGVVPLIPASRGQVDLKSLAVAWCPGEGSVPVRSDVVAVVEHAAAALTGAVQAVTEARPPGLSHAAELFLKLRDAEGLPEVRSIIARRNRLISPDILAYLDRTSKSASVGKMLDLVAQRDRLRALVLAFLDQWQILMLPVASVTAPLIGTDVCDIDDRGVPWAVLGSSCRAISILGLPSAVVPCGLGHDTMPIGVQVVGRPFADREVLAVAAALEQRMGSFFPPPLPSDSAPPVDRGR